jgi:Tail-tube assembly protein
MSTKTPSRYIFPQIPPKTPNPVASGVTGIGKDSAFANQVQDYLKITIYDAESSNPYNYITQTNPTEGTTSGIRGSTLNSSPQAANKGDTETIKSRIYLYLPGSLQENYSVNYADNDLGALGVGALNAAGSLMAGNTDIAATLKSTAEGMKPEVALNAIASGISGIGNIFGTGGQVSANAIAALTRKKIMNPYRETTFNGVDNRVHNFSFKLSPRNAQEVMVIRNIIQTLRTSMLPGISGGGLNPNDDTQTADAKNEVNIDTQRGDRWLTIPDFMKLEIVRYKSNSMGEGDELYSSTSKRNSSVLRSIMTFPVKMVLTNFNINLTPDGVYNSLFDVTSSEDGTRGGESRSGWYDDLGPVSYQIDLTFKETAILTRESFTPK